MPIVCSNMKRRAAPFVASLYFSTALAKKKTAQFVPQACC